MDRRFTLAFIAVVGLACNDEAPTTEGTTSTATDTATVDDGTSSGGDTPEVCYPGYERCPCMAGACLEGLVCLSDLCVAPAAPGTSSSDGESTDDGETTMPVDPTDTNDESSESGGEAESSSDEGSESSTGEPVPVCLEGDNYCEDDDFQTCVDGQWEYANCSEVCLQTGYLHEGCANQDACRCEGFADEFCANGAFVTCACAEALYDIDCTDDSMIQWFDGCYTGSQEFVVCLADFEIQSVEDCEIAFAACGV